MEPTGNIESGPQPIELNSEVKDCLYESAKWSNFLSVIFFAILGILVLASAITIVIASMKYSISNNEAEPFVLAMMYIGFSGIYYFPVVFMYRFSKNVIQGIEENNQEIFYLGLKNLRSHFRFLGVLSMVAISLFTMVLIISLSLLAIR
ncbi:MAG TPA: hypothetical protein PLZ52_07445 [Bacteroidales bacterium]|nr:hypothetical protein [Bacteroidales bacterium]HOE05035.1 hypothetical protein [Bacteroidales bacterium]HQL69577.1 hypothetical protein [Bacteroidales bacterium]